MRHTLPKKPWKVVYGYVLDADKKEIFHLKDLMEYENRIVSEAMEIREHIVQAVNSHEEFLDLCKHIVENPEHCNTEIYLKAKSALLKATEQQ